MRVQDKLVLQVLEDNEQSLYITCGPATQSQNLLKIFRS